MIISSDRSVLFLYFMSRYIKYFDDRGKNMSFMIEDDSVLVKYNKICNEIKNTVNRKFNSMPVNDKKYIKLTQKN